MKKIQEITKVLKQEGADDDEIICLHIGWMVFVKPTANF